MPRRQGQATDRLRLIAEYSSDAYPYADPSAFQRQSQLNFGVEWQATERLARVMRDSGATQPQFCARNVTADMERLVESAGKVDFTRGSLGLVLRF